MKLTLSLIANVLLLALLLVSAFTTCHREPTQTLDPTLAANGKALEPNQHLEMATALRGNEQTLPLAIWHYQQFIHLANHREDVDSGALDLAQMQLSACLRRWMQQLNREGMDYTGASEAAELKLRNLERRNADLQSWISRVTTENRALREALIETQRR